MLTGDQLSRLDEGTAVIKRMRCLPIKTKFDYFYKLGIKRVSVCDIPIDIIDVDLNNLIYDFEPIGNEIGLLKQRTVCAVGDYTDNKYTITPFMTGKIKKTAKIKASAPLSKPARSGMIKIIPNQIPVI